MIAPRGPNHGQPAANEPNPEDRFDVRVLGRVIGTSTDLDIIEEEVTCYNNFQPSPSVDLAEGNLTIHYPAGVFQYHNKEGDVVDTRDILAIVDRLPRL